MILPFVMVFFVSSLQELEAAFWHSSIPDGQLFYSCSGGRITIPWQYITASGDIVNDVQWFYSGNSDELIAIAAHGRFLPLPAFAQTVQGVDNAGLILNNVTAAQSGNYTVEVNGFNSDDVRFTLRHFVIVHVSNGLMTVDESLHVIQNPEAVMDSSTGQWTIQLQCGNFTFKGDPLFPVEWTTSYGHIRTSTDFSEGHFNLLLKNPVQGGNYTCKVPPQHLQDACLQEKPTPVTTGFHALTSTLHPAPTLF